MNDLPEQVRPDELTQAVKELAICCSRLAQGTAQMLGTKEAQTLVDMARNAWMIAERLEANR